MAVLIGITGNSEGMSSNASSSDFGGFGVRPPLYMISQDYCKALDANKDKSLTRVEFLNGFAGWFKTWNTDKSGQLTDAQLRAGIDKTLSPFGGGPPRNPFGDSDA